MPDIKEFMGCDGQRKHFFSMEKALAFITKKKAEDTHHVVVDGAKHIITPKEE